MLCYCFTALNEPLTNWRTSPDLFLKTCLICSVLTVFTQMSVVAWTALTRPRHPVTGTVVVTVTLQLAFGSKASLRTFWKETDKKNIYINQNNRLTLTSTGVSALWVTFIAARASPPKAAGTVTSGSITHTTVTAVTALETVGPEHTRRAAWGWDTRAPIKGAVCSHPLMSLVPGLSKYADAKSYLTR